MINKIEKSNQASGSCKFVLDDKVVLDAKNLEDFNTYRNWGYFPGQVDPVWQSNASDNKQAKSLFHKFTVTKSLFNNIHGVAANGELLRRSNALLLDAPEFRKEEKKDSDCSINTLIENSKKNKMGRQTYRYADFMYCKYLGRVPNNYLITLRRFPFPCGDQITYLHLGKDKQENEIQKHLPDIGRMVTWLGTPGNEITNILNYKVGMPFKEMTAQWEDGGQGGGDSGGLLGTLMNIGGNSSYQKAVMSGYGGSATFDLMGKVFGSHGLCGAPPYEGNVGHRDANKVYGPIDVIKKTHIRGEDGLTFENSFSLTFDYELRSYDGINGKAAFLDLIANILATTYSTGKFWGGGYKGQGLSQHNAFANLPIYKLKPGASFSEITSAVTDSIGMVGQAMNGNKPLAAGGLKNPQNLLSIIKNLGQNLGQALLGGMLNKLGRPQKNAVNSLLSPAPVGFWHVTVGNPMHPIIQMGNMIVDNCQITQYGPLGLDDFPTGLKVVVSLKHAKVRDTTLFEQMFHYGDYRIYSPIDKHIKECYENSSRIMQLKRKDVQTMFEYLKEENKKYGAKLDGTKYEPTIANPSESKTQTSNDTTYSKNTPTPANPNTTTDLSVETEDITSLMASIESNKNIYIKHFGTDDTKNLLFAGQEGADGSEMPKESDKK